MPNGREHVKYDDFGDHEYGNLDGTSDCQYGCGCWMGPARSNGPMGVDPFGKCPGNLLDEKSLSEREIMEDFVNGRIAYLEKEIMHLKEFEILVINAKKSSSIDLQKELKKVQVHDAIQKNQLIRMKDSLRRILEEEGNVSKNRT